MSSTVRSLATAVVLGSAVVVLAAPAWAAKVSISPAPKVGDSWVTTMDTKIEGTLSADGESMSMFSETSFEVHTTVTAVSGADVTGEEVVVKKGVQRAVVPGSEEVGVAFDTPDGSVIKVTRDGSGAAKELVSGVEGAILDDVMQELTPLRPRARDIAIPAGGVSQGNRWDFDVSDFLGRDGTTKGSAKLKSVDGDVATIELKTRTIEAQGETKVVADLSGDVSFSTTSGLCTAMSLGGTLEMSGEMEGTEVTGSATISMTGTWKDAQP